MTWASEWQLILVAAARYGLSPHFIGAIRKTENGGEGKEFGVLSVSAPNYEDQLRVCCQTVRHRLIAYDMDDQSLVSYTAPNGDIVVIYSPAFITYLASIYAPSGANNDPNSLNRNWSRNVSWWLIHLLDADHQAVSGSERA